MKGDGSILSILATARRDRGGMVDRKLNGNPRCLPQAMNHRAALALAAFTALVAGCPGGESYQLRVDRTRTEAEDLQLLDQNLSAPVNGDFRRLALSLRVPRAMTRVDPGPLSSAGERFDLVVSFAAPLEEGDGSQAWLHVLARRARFEGPETSASDSPGSSGFERDVRNLVESTYRVQLTEGAGSTVTQRGRRYRQYHITTPDLRLVELDVHQGGDPQVALLWVLPAARANSELMIKVAPLVLGTLAVGSEAGAHRVEAGDPGKRH
jgi:hypothetical protein